MTRRKANPPELKPVGEFLLTWPVSRQRVLTEKLGVYVAHVLLFSAVVWFASYGAILVFYEGDFNVRSF